MSPTLDGQSLARIPGSSRFTSVAVRPWNLQLVVIVRAHRPINIEPFCCAHRPTELLFLSVKFERSEEE
jgi:hypothetical protein